MRNNFSRNDLDAVINHLKQDDPILTNGYNCRTFEEEWSNWLGVKHSVFVNSGSSANLLSMTVLKLMYPNGGEVIVPPLTWVSDIASVIQVGFTPVFADINIQTLAMDTQQIIEKVNENTRAVFLSHIQGFNGLTDELIEFLDSKKILLVEDVCESHGATHKNKRAGSFGIMSNFSFYYAHHMSTIEGGMVCTNDDEIFEQLRMLRAHGMVREIADEQTKKKYQRNHSELNPQFIFALAGYNMRNNEIGGILGREQLKRLDKNNEKRSRNQDFFLNKINGTFYRTDFFTEGSSNYAFNLILRNKDDKLMNKLVRLLTLSDVEFRLGSAGGGNQLRQPYLKHIVDDNSWELFPVAEHIHFYGMYIGNFPDLEITEVNEIVEIINAAVE
ncbi:MAG: CDP-4-keto-6-deoxy-D-glucose-3-dehydrase [Flavobacteriaceae bacterium]|nr:CDP-4-keto-6-deoxy-D-glucose-3-dehydrase [Flavobacteriaceae bacterium]|tara:strand:+ start:1752 stop:2912 length:1161 start_codon:yes stop_codon:yes gene_type:complete